MTVPPYAKKFIQSVCNYTFRTLIQPINLLLQFCTIIQPISVLLQFLHSLWLQVQNTIQD